VVEPLKELRELWTWTTREEVIGDHMTTRALAIALGIITSALVWSDPGWSTSTSPYRLAFSQKLAAEVFAVPNSGGSWCGSAVNLKVSLSNGSPLLSPVVKADRAAFAAKLGTVLAQECPAATAATVRFVTGPAQSQVDSQAMARGPSGWASVAMTSPAAAPSAQPAPPSPPAAPAAAASIATPPQPEAKPNTLQVGRGYIGLLVKVLRDDPNLANSDAALRYWAQLKFPREYAPLQNQEFALQPLLAKAKADMQQTIADSDPDRIETHIPAQFQTYDFSAHRFPVALSFWLPGQQINLEAPCCPPQGLPGEFRMTVSGLDALNGFPMDEDAAKNFEQRRTRYNSVDRNIWLVATVKVAPGPLTKGSYNSTPVDVTFVGGTFYGDEKCTQQVYTLDETEVAREAAAKAAAKAAAEAAENARLAEAQRQQMAAQAEVQRQQLAAQAAAQREEQAREAEAQHQQMAAQRDSYIQQLRSSSDSVKLANFILPGPVDTSAHLDSLRAARTAALISGHAVDVTMLVQTYSSGSEGVATKWPGHLTVTTLNGQSLKSSSWYIVRGSLTVPEGDDLPDANLAAAAIYACQKDQCADATDAAAIVDHKLAAGN
jgi:hypothetical protein